MNWSRSNTARLLKIASFVIIALIIVGYALFRSLPYVRGPVITAFEPQDGSTISTSTVEVKGVAKRVNSLTLNGMPISIDEEGAFQKVLVVFRGQNNITIEARDQFNRTDKVEIRFLGEY